MSVLVAVGMGLPCSEADQMSVLVVVELPAGIPDFEPGIEAGVGVEVLVGMVEDKPSRDLVEPEGMDGIQTVQILRHWLYATHIRQPGTTPVGE